jgi:hypothetical protein
MVPSPPRSASNGDRRPPRAEQKRSAEDSLPAPSRFNSEDRRRAVEARAAHDAVTASALLHNEVLELAGSYSDVRRRWTPSLKTRSAAIAEWDPELHARLAAFHAAGFDERLALARKMVRLIYDAQPR